MHKPNSIKSTHSPLLLKNIALCSLIAFVSCAAVLLSLPSRSWAKPHPTELLELSRLKMINQTRIETLKKTVGSCPKQLAEYELRREFFDRLTLKLDRATRVATPSNAWLADLVDSMAKTEASNPRFNEKLWRFMVNLGSALKRLPKESQAGVNFIEGYVNFSSIRQPKSFEEFESQLSYGNGLEFAAARDFEKDQLGEEVEKRLQPELSKLQPRPTTSFEPLTNSLSERP